jgi:hypothetical protein
LAAIFGRDKKMKIRHSLVLVIVAAAVLVTFNNRCLAQRASADANEAASPTPQPELDNALIDTMMMRLAEMDAIRAEELQKLRKTEPEKFRQEIEEVMREIGRPQAGGRYEREGRRGRRQHMRMPYEARGQHGRRWSAIMRQRHEEYLEWLQDNYPDQAKELLELKEKDPQLYMRKLALSFETYGRIAEVAKENPKLAEVLKKDLELKKQRDDLLSKIKTTKDDQKKQKLIKELEEVVGARFDLVVEKTRIRYDQLNKRLGRLEKEIKENEAKVEQWKNAEFKKRNVKARMEELLGKTEGFKWE